MALANIAGLSSKLPGILSGMGSIALQQTRNAIYYDRNTNERHTDPEALDRYFRLRWGAWIRPKAGFKRKLWRKPWHMRWYAGQHIFVKKEQAKELEKMIAPKYKKTRYFIDDIYEPYHERVDFDVCPDGRRHVTTSYVKMMHKD